jgi:hypothetical protein
MNPRITEAKKIAATTPTLRTTQGSLKGQRRLAERPLSIDGWSLIVRCLTYADKVCLRWAGGHGTRQGSARRCKGEVTMLLIPVVLVIGGILALVLYLEKTSPPYHQ